MSRVVKCNLCGASDYSYYKNPSGDRRIVRCSKCGLIFTNPQPDENEIAEMLDKETSPPQEVLDIEKDKFKIYLDEIETLIKRKKGKLLDIGCGFGYLLAIAKERGWDTLGVEFNKKRVDLILEKYGIEVFCGDLASAKYQPNSFDVVTIIEVLEHILDPSLFLKEVNRIVKKDGLVAIVTPNVGSFYAKTDPNWWTSYHFYHFSPKTLEAILAKNGIKIVKIVINPHLETRKDDKSFFVVRKSLFDNFRWGIVLIRKVLGLKAVAEFMGNCGAIKTGGITIYGKKSHNILILIAAFLTSVIITGYCFSEEINIIPAPQNMENKAATVDIKSDWDIVSDIPDSRENDFLVSYLKDEFLNKAGISLGVWKTQNLPSNSYILLALAGSNRLNQALKNQDSHAADKIGEEGYVLNVFNDRIIIAANNNKGVFYGIQTLLQLAKSSERGANINAVKIVDYPRIKNRGVHFSGPDPEKLKGYIDKMASLKLNIAIIETQDYYNLANKGTIYEEIFEYARERNIEPVPELASFGAGSAVLRKDPLAAEGIFICDAKFKAESGEIRSEDPARYPLLNVMKGGNCDIQVKSTATGEIYREGIDYDVIKGELKYPYSSDNRPTKILQKKNGKIKEGDEVLVSYNYVENKCASWAPWSMPYCPSYEGTYEIMSQAITETINRLHPRYLSIGHDEIRGMNRDSRCKRRNMTNAELLADEVNKLNDFVKSIGPDIRLMMWDDMVNPWHNGGDENYQVQFGGVAGKTSEAIDLIPKDIIMMVWWGDAKDWLNKMKNSPSYFESNGFDYIVVAYKDKINIKNWGELIKKRPKCMGLITTTWDGWDKNLDGIKYTAEEAW